MRSLLLLLAALQLLPGVSYGAERGSKTQAVKLNAGASATGHSAEVSAKAPAMGANISATAPLLPVSAMGVEPSAVVRAAASIRAEPAVAGEASRHPLIDRVRAEAEKLGGSTVVSDVDAGLSALRSMRTQGFSFVPREAAVQPQELRAINDQIDAGHRAVQTWELYGPPGRWTSRADPNNAHARMIPDNGGEMRPVIDRITHLLRSALPSENLVLRDAQLRLSYEDNAGIHVDSGGHITVTIALRGPGTLVYRVGAGGVVEELQAPLGAAAVITNLARQAALGIEGTVHSAPTKRFFKPGEERRVLIMRYASATHGEVALAESRVLGARNAQRVGAANAFRARREGRAPQPPPKGSLLKGLFGLE
jgi:hypothetical protein